MPPDLSRFNSRSAEVREERTFILGFFILGVWITGLDTNTPGGYYILVMDSRTKNTIIRRLRIIEGQIRGLQRLVKKDAYCIEIIHQSLAVKEALSGVEDLILENHLSTHVIEQIKSGEEKKSVKEILEVYKVSKKK